MFRADQGLLLTQDWVSPELIRAGMPRVSGYRGKDQPSVVGERARVDAPARRRSRLLHRLLRPVLS